VKPRHDRSSTLAAALVGAYLAGEWDPPAMGRRAKRALGDRRKWLTDLAHVVHAGYPERPADRPRELAGFIEACELFSTALVDRRRPLRVHVWMAAPTEMVTPRWPVHPVDDLAELSTWLGVTQDRLAWIADRRSLERSVTDERLRHYSRRWLRKADGSARLLEAPKTETKDLQRQILRAILDRIPAHEAAHGFRSGRSVLTAAAPHRGQQVVIRIDLETFFTTVTAGRVYGLFRLAGYPEPVAHALTGLCTTVTPTAVLRDAPDAPPHWVAKRRRMLQALREPHLPQGSPTSPALANLVAYGLDRRLSGLAAKLGATYTRYADDLIFSGPEGIGRRAGSIVERVRTIAEDEGFRVHDGKTRVRTAAQRQLVTGLVVNERLNVTRAEYDRLRAVLHDAARHGPDAANREGHPAFEEHLRGRVGWVGGANDARAAKLRHALDQIDW
jgi:retron-type reverse transcriptase